MSNNVYFKDSFLFYNYFTLVLGMYIFFDWQSLVMNCCLMALKTNSSVMYILMFIRMAMADFFSWFKFFIFFYLYALSVLDGEVYSLKGAHR